MTIRILQGDSLTMLKTLADQSVQCCVTSPPYFGLRDYGMPGQIGLEDSPAEFIDVMVDVFREVRRVLKDDGTLWLNLGDSYCSAGGEHAGRADNQTGVGAGKRQWREGAARADGQVRGDGPVSRRNRNGTAAPGLKSKDLIGIPWRVAFALQADGWHLRQDIIWHKPNPMPESVTDRCTKSHEYIFLLSKSARYYYDAESIAEPVSPNTHARLSQDVQKQIGSERANGGAKTNGNMKAVGRKFDPGAGNKNNPSFDAAMAIMPDIRNKRSVWTITTKPFSEAHFATFPPELPETCIKAGSKPGDTILDPFFGAGTTGLVADRLGRDCVGIELNPQYAEIARRRIQGDAPLFAEVEAA